MLWIKRTDQKRRRKKFNSIFHVGFHQQHRGRRECMRLFAELWRYLSIAETFAKLGLLKSQPKGFLAFKKQKFIFQRKTLPNTASFRRYMTLRILVIGSKIKILSSNVPRGCQIQREIGKHTQWLFFGKPP